MKRTLIVTIALVFFAMTAPVSMAADIKIALDCPPDPDHCGTYYWSTVFADHLKESGLAATLYPADALGGEEEKLDQVSQGLLEVSNSDVSKVGQLDPTIMGIGLPYIIDSVAQMDRIIESTDFMNLINAKSAKHGVRTLAVIPVGGFSGLANTKHPVRTPADLKDLRMRAMDNIQVQILKSWGANTVVIPWPEIYNSLQTGVADGYLNSAIVPVMFKHTEILKHFSDLKLAAPIRVTICSETWYSGLSKKDRGIVDAAVAKANAANREWLKGSVQRDLDELGKSGVEVYQNTKEERDQFARLVRPIYKDLVPPEIAELFIKLADATK
ncbi:MAG: TRAP transporter substrate-binding protein [Desulfobacteraceae bacterium]|nr:TRAP transporter substrate-binding protein [Desulfobacteraceae bacterium]